MQVEKFVRAGCFPEVAAEAVGVPVGIFRGWLQRAERKPCPIRYVQLRDKAARGGRTSPRRGRGDAVSGRPHLLAAARPRQGDGDTARLVEYAQGNLPGRGGERRSVAGGAATVRWDLRGAETASRGRIVTSSRRWSRRTCGFQREGGSGDTGSRLLSWEQQEPSARGNSTCSTSRVCANIWTS